MNPVDPASEAETVTLLNTTPDAVDLTGWPLLDRMKHPMPLAGITIPAGDTVRIPVQVPVQLGNQVASSPSWTVQD